uniref:Uncharacterized protein n=1 Tax=Leptospirillum ferriphilum TaxID=178606 RepID=A0A2I2MCX5_9BACT
MGRDFRGRTGYETMHQNGDSLLVWIRRDIRKDLLLYEGPRIRIGSHVHPISRFSFRKEFWRQE